MKRALNDSIHPVTMHCKIIQITAYYPSHLSSPSTPPFHSPIDPSNPTRLSLIINKSTMTSRTTHQDPTPPNPRLPLPSTVFTLLPVIILITLRASPAHPNGEFETGMQRLEAVVTFAAGLGAER